MAAVLFASKLRRIDSRRSKWHEILPGRGGLYFAYDAAARTGFTFRMNSLGGR